MEQETRFETLGIYKDNHNVVMNKRISWDQYFMRQAFNIAQRSPDAQTKHGICLTKDNRQIASGYNGFPKNAPDHIIPNIRPYKYPFMNHAELSAVLDAAERGVSIKGCKAYITGHPCCECCKLLCSLEIFDWVIGNIGFVQTEKDKILSEFWLSHYPVKITLFDENLLTKDTLA